MELRRECIRWKLEYKEEDERMEEEDDVRVMREFRKLCNSIWPWIHVKRMWEANMRIRSCQFWI